MKKVIFVMGLSVATLGATAGTSIKNVTTVKVATEEGKKVEIDAAKLPEKITKSLGEKKATKAYQVMDAAGLLKGYEVVVLTNSKEETFKYDKNGDLLKETIAPQPK
ncbi:MAG: hypothetical protein ACYDCN_12695 [Bacteroidia bacterium]